MLLTKKNLSKAIWSIFPKRSHIEDVNKYSRRHKKVPVPYCATT